LNATVSRATPRKRKHAMPKPDASRIALDLKVGEWVEVRSRGEILATLDGRGRAQNLPFMPEMLNYCGRRFRVFKRADKTCDPAHAPWSIRRMTNSVHLEGVRCNGEGHGGCQAGCLIFWKEAWLKRVENSASPSKGLESASQLSGNDGMSAEASILSASQWTDLDGETVYSCQATELRNFTSRMSSWDLRQYIRDLRSGNLRTGLASDLRAHQALETVLGIIKIIQAGVISLFNRVQGRRHGIPYPFIEGSGAKMPVELLDLQPGELVQIRSKEEIMETLGKDQRDRGLWFDSEMLPYCGGFYRVLRRVRRIIDENSGKMIEMKHPCIVLEGVVCQSHFHRLCPRAIYPYWRENWLKRASDSGESAPSSHRTREDSGTPSAPVTAASK
jgi:hypothetical protein